MRNQYQLAQAAVWLSVWAFAYLAVGFAFAWKIIPKWRLSSMRKYVEIQYDYHLRISKEPGVPKILAAEYRKRMRACAADGEALKRDVPKMPFSHWWILWPMEIFACLKAEAMTAKVRKQIRSWDARRAP